MMSRIAVDVRTGGEYFHDYVDGKRRMNGSMPMPVHKFTLTDGASLSVATSEK
jgi:hypothetical protein